jgi:hypothetical protein
MKSLKKPPLKFKPTPRKPPASQPKPKPAATAVSQAEPKTFDSIRIDRLERRIDLIAEITADQLSEIFYALGQIADHLGQPLRRFYRAPDAEKSETINRPAGRNRSQKPAEEVPAPGKSGNAVASPNR